MHMLHIRTADPQHINQQPAQQWLQGSGSAQRYLQQRTQLEQEPSAGPAGGLTRAAEVAGGCNGAEPAETSRKLQPTETTQGKQMDAAVCQQQNQAIFTQC